MGDIKWTTRYNEQNRSDVCWDAREAAREGFILVYPFSLENRNDPMSPRTEKARYKEYRHSVKIPLTDEEKMLYKPNIDGEPCPLTLIQKKNFLFERPA